MQVIIYGMECHFRFAYILILHGSVSLVCNSTVSRHCRIDSVKTALRIVS